MSKLKKLVGKASLSPRRRYELYHFTLVGYTAAEKAHLRQAGLLLTELYRRCKPSPTKVFRNSRTNRRRRGHRPRPVKRR